MQTAISQGATSSATTPLLDIWTQHVITDDTGFPYSGLADPYALSFQIFSTPTEDAAPVQVFPGGSGRHTVDLTADKIGGQAGHFAAAWTAPASGDAAPNAGCFRIIWYVTLTNGAAETQMVRDFDVWPYVVPVLGPRYCLVSDLRDEGVAASDVGPGRILRLIAQASAYVDRVTGQFFEPRYMTQTLDGNGGRAVLAGDPIIAYDFASLGQPAVSNIGPESVRVYNRHISQGMLSPDDRLSPRVEFMHFRDLFGRQRSASVDSPLFGVPFRDLFFPAGVQNVNLSCLFGYTDPDGSSQGRTPDLIRHVTKMLVLRDLYPMTDDRAEDQQKRFRLTQEKVRDQSYVLQDQIEGPFTGDRRIDDILLQYVRPPRIGST